MNHLDAIRTPHKTGRLLLAPSFTSGRFDSLGVDCPFPFTYEGRRHMTFIGFDGMGYRTGIASSPDLVNWTNDGLLIDRGPAGSPTEHNIALTWILRDSNLESDGDVVPHDGGIVGTYHAYPEPGYEAGPASIGFCTSTNLREWDMRAPCLHARDGADWERGGLYKSCLVKHDDMFYLFYNAKTEGNPWIEQTGVATSHDLVHWKRYGKNPVLPVGEAGAIDDRFASDPCVLRLPDGTWVMFFFTLSSDGRARETVAFSDDLLHWEKSNEVLVDVGPEGSIDARYAHKPGIAWHAGTLYHYYCAVAPLDRIVVDGKETRERRGITLASSCGVLHNSER